MDLSFTKRIIKARLLEKFDDLMDVMIKKPTRAMSDEIEEIWAEFNEGLVVNKKGYDVIYDGILDEVKSTFVLAGRNILRIGGLANKRISTNIVIFDFINQRVSKIPTKVFYKEADIVTGAKTAEFHWYADYSTIDGKKKTNNTKLFLKYEVK